MTPLVQTITTILSLNTILADILIIIFFLLIILAWVGNESTKNFLKSFSSRALLIIAFILSLAAPVGSLFYSQIAGFAPCEFCWWQRIFAYPLVIIFTFGLWSTRKSKKISSESQVLMTNLIVNITLTLSTVGAAIAAYHSYGQLLNPDVLPACAATGVSCAKLYFVEYHYVAIPTMSLTAFLSVIVTLLVYKIAAKK